MQSNLPYNQQLKSIIILSLAFMLMFTSYTSVEGILTKFYQSQGYIFYGRISLITIYLFFALSTTYSSIIIKYLGYKMVFIFGALFYAILDSSALIIYFTTNTVISIGIIMFSSILCGIAAGSIWVAQNAYIVEISKENSSQMFGIFQGVRSISVVIGFLLTVYIFKYYDGYTYFLILIPLSILSILILFTLPNPIPTNITLSSEFGLIKIKNYFKLLSIKQNYQIYSYESLNSFPPVLVSNFAFKIVDLIIIIDEDQSQQKYEARLTYLFGIVLLWYGIGRMLSSFLVKKIIQKINYFQFCQYSSYSCIVSIIIGTLSYYLLNYQLCCIFSFLLGISYAMTRTSVNILIKELFGNNIDLIGINYFISSISFIGNVVILFVINKIATMYVCFGVYFGMLVVITIHVRRIEGIFGKKKKEGNGLEVELCERKL